MGDQKCSIEGVARHNLETFKKQLAALEKKAAEEQFILTEAQIAALERSKQEKETQGEIETEHPGYLRAQDTYTKVAFVKLYDRKTALVAADLLNDQVLPWFEQQERSLLRILTDRGTEYCGSLQHHEYQLYLAVENINHRRTKARHPQTNGICERFHRAMQDEFYAVAFRKKVYTTLEELQADVDEWLEQYNRERTHSGKYCFGRTPLQTFRETKHLAQAKMLDTLMQREEEKSTIPDSRVEIFAG